MNEIINNTIPTSICSVVVASLAKPIPNPSTLAVTNPIIAKYVGISCFSNKYSINLAIRTIPIKIPIPNGASTKKLCPNCEKSVKLPIVPTIG